MPDMRNDAAQFGIDEDTLDVLQQFLVDIMQRIPDDLEIETRNLQHELEILDAHLKRVKRQNQAVAASLDRIGEIVEMLRKVATSFGDSSMRATVIRPLIRKFRELAERGELDIGFTDEEWTNDLDGASGGAIAGRGDAHDV